MQPLCIFHADCYDGFAAAWVVNRYYKGEVEFFRGVYSGDLPDVAGRNVLMVDFSYSRPIMEVIAESCASLTVFEHHDDGRAEMLLGLRERVTGGKIHVVFDKERSGAGITWDVLFDGEPRPPLIDRIEDRDIWRWKYGNSRLVHAALESYEFKFNVWDILMERPLVDLVAQGVRLEAKHWNEINMLLPITRRLMRIDGRMVPVANLPITLCSDAGQELAKGVPFAATYMDTPAGRQFSLRSSSEDYGVNVAVIAKKYGELFGTSGGGHPHAAGFLATRGWEGDSVRSLLEESPDEGIVVGAQDS